MSYLSRATGYAERVTNGKQLAGKFIRLACQRFLADLNAQEDVEFPYRMDEQAAARWCGFIELLPHVKGRWANEGQRMTLEDWQVFLLTAAFGWLRKADGLRRYRRTYIEVPRKNGKSQLTAAIGLRAFCADGEHGAEVYSGAGTEKQAWEVFGPARLMAKQAGLEAALGVTVAAKSLFKVDNASKFEPIIGKPGDGASPSFSITDEYHEHQTSEQYDTMVTGMGARDQPMAWVITTAGSSIEGPCYDLRGEVIDVLEGRVENPELFGLIYTIDEGDDWSSPDAIRKANPNLGVSVREDYLMSQLRDAVSNPRKQSIFKTKHLNVWVQAASPYFDSDAWRDLGDSSLTPDLFEGEPCWVGMDLAAKLDLTSVVSVFVREKQYYVFGKHYLPESALEPPEAAHYRAWHIGGHLNVTTTYQHTDYDEIEADIVEISKRHRIVQLGFDPWGATQVATHLANEGIPVVQVGQTVQHLSEPMKWLQALIADGRIHHNGDPVMAWALANVTAQEDRNGNVFPRKERPERKIDPAVALIMALGRAFTTEEPRGSVYEDEGVFIL
jgi:phage terminase large subunit-like protein